MNRAAHLFRRLALGLGLAALATGAGCLWWAWAQADSAKGMNDLTGISIWMGGENRLAERNERLGLKYTSTEITHAGLVLLALGGFATGVAGPRPGQRQA